MNRELILFSARDSSPENSVTKLNGLKRFCEGKTTLRGFPPAGGAQNRIFHQAQKEYGIQIHTVLCHNPSNRKHIKFSVWKLIHLSSDTVSTPQLRLRGPWKSIKEIQRVINPQKMGEFSNLVLDACHSHLNHKRSPWLHVASEMAQVILYICLDNLISLWLQQVRK